MGRGKRLIGITPKYIAAPANPLKQRPEIKTNRSTRGPKRLKNRDPMTEQVNMLETARAYEANIAAAEATKSMMQTSLRLIA